MNGLSQKLGNIFRVFKLFTFEKCIGEIDTLSNCPIFVNLARAQWMTNFVCQMSTWNLHASRMAEAKKNGDLDFFAPTVKFNSYLIDMKSN